MTQSSSEFVNDNQCLYNTIIDFNYLARGNVSESLDEGLLIDT